MRRKDDGDLEWVAARFWILLMVGVGLLLSMVALAQAVSAAPPIQPKHGDDGHKPAPLDCDAVSLDTTCNTKDNVSCDVTVDRCCCLSCQSPFCHCLECSIIPAGGATAKAMLDGEFTIQISDGDRSRVLRFVRGDGGEWVAAGRVYHMGLPGKFSAVPVVGECAE